MSTYTKRSLNWTISTNQVVVASHATQICHPETIVCHTHHFVYPVLGR